MATARSNLIDNRCPLHYHLVSRCVRRSFLCGNDRRTNRNYDHRKQWITQRLFHLARYFAVEVDAYAIMSNHFHLVVFYDPLEQQRWSDAEVAQRWTDAFPPRLINGNVNDLEVQKALTRDAMLQDTARMQKARRCLGSLSSFMKHLKQPIAWRANRQDRCTGHFFEARFYSGALLSEAAVLAAMAYVDLNPVRAKIARDIASCHDCSISQRLAALENSAGRLQALLGPLVSGLNGPDQRLPITLETYMERLREVISAERPDRSPDPKSRWHARVAAIRKRLRAFGSEAELRSWQQRQGWKRLPRLSSF